MSRWTWILRIGMFLLGVQSNAIAVSEQYSRDFWMPMYEGKRLNYCLSNNSTCGQAVAHRYCHMLGYDKSIHSTMNYNVGMARYLDKKKCCIGWRCNGFKLIRCSAQTLHGRPHREYYYRAKEFIRPDFNNYRIDWCFQNGDLCGQRAAHAFCRRMGYEKALSFRIEPNLPATRALGNERVCFGKCTGFETIICHR